MESRANYAAIGLFVLVMIATGLGFLYWLTNAGEKAAMADVRVIFSGPVTGLTTGSAVLFNGIKVGEVAELALDEQDPNTVIAIIRVDRNKPIRTDTRATLSYQGLTGVANLQLEGGSRNAPLLIEAVEGPGMPTIHADVSPFQDILESARNVLTRADSAMAAIDDFVNDNGPAFNRTVNNVETFSRALADNADGVDQVLANVSKAAASLAEISDNLQGTVTRAEQILAAVDPQRVTELVQNLTAASENLGQVLQRADAVVAGIDPAVVSGAVQNVADAAEVLQRTIARADSVLAGFDPAEIKALVASLRQTSDQIGTAATNADALIGSVDAERIRSIVDQVDVAATGLADATRTVNGVVEAARQTMAQVSGVVAAVDPQVVGDAVGNVSEAAAGLRQTVEQARAVVAGVTPEAVQSVMTQLSQSADSIGAAATRAEELVAAIDVAQVRGIVDQVASAAGGLGTVVDQARTTLASANSVVAAVDPQVVRDTVQNVRTFTEMLRDSRPQVDAILADVRSASQSLSGLGDTISARREDIDSVIADARTLAGQLNGIAARTDTLLQKVDGYVEADGQGLVAQASETLASIREVADTLNGRIGPITDNVARFTDRGLDSYVRLADEGRRALSRLNQVLSGIERDPQQFIFGGSGVPEYAPRRR